MQTKAERRAFQSKPADVPQGRVHHDDVREGAKFGGIAFQNLDQVVTVTARDEDERDLHVVGLEVNITGLRQSRFHCCQPLEQKVSSPQRSFDPE